MLDCFLKHTFHNLFYMMIAWALEIDLRFKNNFIKLFINTILLNQIWIKTNKDTKKYRSSQTLRKSFIIIFYYSWVITETTKKP